MPRKGKTPEVPATRKLVAVTWRDALDNQGNEWEREVLQITGYTVNAAGVLALFCAGSVIRTIAPGYWADVNLIGEEPTSPSEESAPREEVPA